MNDTRITQVTRVTDIEKRTDVTQRNGCNCRNANAVATHGVHGSFQQRSAEGVDPSHAQASFDHEKQLNGVSK